MWRSIQIPNGIFCVLLGLERKSYRAGGWCKETKKVLEGVGMSRCWDEEEVGGAKEWKARVKQAVGEREVARWRWGMIHGGAHVKGERMAKVKLERYIEDW